MSSQNKAKKRWWVAHTATYCNILQHSATHCITCVAKMVSQDKAKKLSIVKPYTHSRALYTLIRAVSTLKRAPFTRKTALLTLKRALQFIRTQELFLHSKAPYTHSKQPHMCLSQTRWAKEARCRRSLYSLESAVYYRFHWNCVFEGCHGWLFWVSIGSMCVCFRDVEPHRRLFWYIEPIDTQKSRLCVCVIEMLSQDKATIC